MKALLAIALMFGFLVGDMTTNDGARIYQAKSFALSLVGR
jgi:hypothetical protein